MIILGEVHYTRLQDLNDPFDLSFNHRLPIDENELIKFVGRMCLQTYPDATPFERRQHFKHMIDEIRTFTKGSEDGLVPPFPDQVKLGVLCLSAIPNDVLMWSHYADHHKGVCIGIRTSCLKEKRILPVNYSEDRPIIDAWSYVGKNREVFVNATRIKGLHWKYEEEWRTVHDAGPRLYPACVDRVVIGVRANAATRQAVFEAVDMADHEIEVFDAKVHNTQFRLEVVPAEKPW